MSDKNLSNFDIKFVPIKSDFEKKLASNRSKKNWQDPAYIEKNLQRQFEGVSNPLYKKKKSKQMKKIAQSDEWKNQHQKSRQKVLEDPNLGEKISKGLKNVLSSPEAKSKKKEVACKNYENPEYVKNRQIGLIKAIGTPCMTDEGPFIAVSEAGKHYNKIRNFNNGAKWVKGMIKKGASGFYYITREEYDKIKG